MQWHPLLAELLRPVVEAYYEVQTNVPVGDLPREADIVLLRRKSTGRTPFHSVWAGLRTWNLLEFKSPSVAPQLRDLDLLVEIGLGIDRRLNDERAKQRIPLLPRNETAFWYLVNRLSDRFVAKCHTTLGAVRPCGVGVWRADVLERPLFLVSNADLPVDHESLPLHVVSHGSLEAEREVARFVAT